jgi:molybdopterin synthase catalytic subunit
LAVRVQAEDFDVGREVTALTAANPGIGAIAVFVGLVRDQADGAPVTAMTLEHYPGMTEREIARIDAEARRRWPLADTLVIHRFGRLAPNDRIVLVATASAHRDAAFDACRFVIDWLKTRAPFWKLEEGAAGRRWVEARDDDDRAAARWSARGAGTVAGGGDGRSAS